MADFIIYLFAVGREHCNLFLVRAHLSNQVRGHCWRDLSWLCKSSWLHYGLADHFQIFSLKGQDSSNADQIRFTLSSHFILITLFSVFLFYTCSFLMDSEVKEILWPLMQQKSLMGFTNQWFLLIIVEYMPVYANAHY